MCEFPDAKHIRRDKVYSRPSSNAPPDLDPDLEARYHEQLSKVYSSEPREEISLTDDAQARGAPIVGNDEGHLEEDGYDFRLFSRPSAKPTDSKSRCTGLQRIVLRSPSPANGEPGFVDLRRLDSYYFSRPTTAETLEQYRVAAVTGEEIMRGLDIRWPGAEMPWRVTVIKTRSHGRVLKATAFADTPIGKRGRSGKKRRISLRKKFATKAAIASAKKQSQAEKEAAEKEKRTRRNREKKVKRKEKEKLKKVCKNRTYCGSKCQSGDWETHKRTCKRQNFLLQIQLAPGEIENPPITRTLSYPAVATFQDFHEALQIAFGWASTHDYDFKVKDPVAEAQADAAEQAEDMQSFMLRIERSMGPGADGSGNRRYALRIVKEQQGTFFSGRGVDSMYSGLRKHPQTPEKKSHKIRLHEVFEREQYQGLLFEYEYDFGDCWRHDIKVIARTDATDFFMCTDGEGHGCAEDAGNTTGWEELKTAYRASDPTQEQKEKIRWYEEDASNRDRRGLGGGREREWAKGMINRKLAELSGQAIGFS